MKSVNLNLLEPSGPLQAITALLFFYLLYQVVIQLHVSAKLQGHLQADLWVGGYPVNETQHTWDYTVSCERVSGWAVSGWANCITLICSDWTTAVGVWVCAWKGRALLHKSNKFRILCIWKCSSLCSYLCSSLCSCLCSCLCNYLCSSLCIYLCSCLCSYLCSNEHETFCLGTFRTFCFPSVFSRPLLILFWTQFITNIYILLEKVLQKPQWVVWQIFVERRDTHFLLQSPSIRVLDASCLVSSWRFPRRIIRKQCHWWWGREVPSRRCSSISKYNTELFNSKTILRCSFHALWHTVTHCDTLKLW